MSAEEEVDKQVNIMHTKLKYFDTLEGKLKYMSDVFDPDPAFTLEARNQVRHELAVAQAAQEPTHGDK